MRGLVLKDEEVRALMRDGVVVVRRIVKPSPEVRDVCGSPMWTFAKPKSTSRLIWPNAREQVRALCPLGQPGERRFLKEGWQFANWTEDGCPLIRYRADNGTRWAEDAPDLTDVWAALSEPANYNIDNTAADRRWRSAMHMTRELCRTHTECTHATAEQVDGVWSWVATYKRVEG